MKQKILKLSTVILLFAFIGAGCQKDDIFELEIGDKDAVIVKEVDGVEFKFCLLNAQGEPATVFDEGENFTFTFSIKNNRKEQLRANQDNFQFIQLKDFFAVKKRNKYYGKAYKFDFPENYQPMFPAILNWFAPSTTKVIDSPLFKSNNEVSLTQLV